MAKRKKLTPEMVYLKNQKKVKVFKNLTPIVYWLFLGLCVMFLMLTIENSVGNITEIIEMLDKNSLTGEELSENYQYLVEKWGEWVVIGEYGGVVSVQFVNIGNAFFSGLMVTFLTLSIISLCVAIIGGKIILPKLAEYYADNNQSLVDIATLQTHAEITKSNKTKKKTNNKEEWF